MSPRQTASGQHSPAQPRTARSSHGTEHDTVWHDGSQHCPNAASRGPNTAQPGPDSVPAQPGPAQCGPLRGLGSLLSVGTRRGRQAPSPPQEAGKVWFRPSAGVLLTRPRCMSQPGDAGHTLNANAASRSGLVSGFSVQPAANLQHFCGLACPQPHRWPCPRHSRRLRAAGACGVPGQRALPWLGKPPATCPGPWEHAAWRVGGPSSNLDSTAAGLCDLASRVWQAACVIWT